MDMQNVKNLTIPEGGVKTIHDKGSRLLWGAVGYNTTYRGDTFQQTYSGKNLFNSSTVQAGDIRDNNTGIRLCSLQNLYLPTGTYTFSNNAVSPIQYFVSTNSVGAPFLSTYPTYSYNSGWVTAGVSTTFTLTEPGYFVVQYRKAGDAAITVADISGYNFQLEAGSSATSFEPYIGGTASPSPDYPQDVQVVTGIQTVNVHGKNLFNSYIATKPGWQSGTLVVNPDGTFTVSGNTGSNNYFQLGQTLATLCPKLKVGDQVYLYLDTTSASKRIYTNGTWVNGEMKTITQAMLNAAVVIYGGYNQTDTIKIMVTKALETTYEAYQSQDYTVGLTSKNLLNLSTTATSGVSFDPATNTYSSSTRLGTSTWVQKLVATSDTYTFSCSSASQAEMRYCFSDQDLFTANDIITLAANTPDSIVSFGNRTVTNSNNAKYLYVTFRAAFNGTMATLVEPMLEVGSTATSYQSYFNYELCKIGDYQDNIYQNEGSWYVHKETTSNYLVGGTIGMAVSKQSGTGRFNIILPTTWEAYKKLAGSTTFSKCNSYIVVAQGTTNGDFDTNASSYNYALNFNSSTGNALRIKNIDLSTVEDMEDSMTVTPLVLYYVLATPTDTIITDPTLISQLDAIHEWLTRYGYYGDVSGNLPMIIGRTNL